MTKLILIYHLEIDVKDSNNEKVLSCLSHFFQLFVQKIQNLNLLVKIFVPLVNYSFKKSYSMQFMRKIASFFYYLTSGFTLSDKEEKKTNNTRLFLIDSILDEICKTKFNDYFNVQKWIEILIEFNVHQFDVCDDEKEIDDLLRESLEYLQEIMLKLQLIQTTFKKEKWKLDKIDLIKLMHERCKQLLNRNKKFLLENESKSNAKRLATMSMMQIASAVQTPSKIHKMH